MRTLRTAIEQCQELVFVTDLAGTIQYANPACEIVTGYNTHELLESGLDRMTVEISEGKSWRFLRDHALEAGGFRGALGLTCKNGGTAELDLAMTVVCDPRTQATSLVCTALAIAIKREIPAISSRGQNLDAIGALTSGVAHDFNNLLMVIGAYAEMGLTTLSADHSARRNLQEILAAVRRASDLTRRLLTAARRRSKGQELISINWIIEDVAAMLSRIMEEDIEVRVSLGKNVGMVKADPGQIEQVLLNLAINARDAMPNGGELSIETESVQVGDDFVRTHPGTKPGEQVLLTFSDSGHGMRADQLKRVFEPYYTTKAPGKGTGLGLAIVHSIVQQSGGCICLASGPNVGTRFQIYLPVATHTGKKPAALWREQANPPRGHEAVLVVEDAEPLRRATTEFLSSLGYTVNSAANGEEALRILENNHGIDLIIADVVMPHMNGPRLTEHAVSRWPHTKILFSSGHAESVVHQKGTPALDRNFLQKPFSLNTLALQIRAILDEPVRTRAAAASAGR